MSYNLAAMILLRSTLVYKLIEATLSTPPLLFRRQPSQLNCLSAGFFSFFLKIIITLVNNWYLTFRFRSQLFCVLISVLSQQITVKFLGSFRPSRISGYVHPHIQFRWVSRQDSPQIVTRFMQVGIYPTRCFAHDFNIFIYWVDSILKNLFNIYS